MRESPTAGGIRCWRPSSIASLATVVESIVSAVGDGSSGGDEGENAKLHLGRHDGRLGRWIYDSDAS